MSNLFLTIFNSMNQSLYKHEKSEKELAGFQRRGSGFTAIEVILIVVAIAILISIIFVAVGRSR